MNACQSVKNPMNVEDHLVEGLRQHPTIDLVRWMNRMPGFHALKCIGQSFNTIIYEYSCR